MLILFLHNTCDLDVRSAAIPLRCENGCRLRRPLTGDRFPGMRSRGLDYLRDRQADMEGVSGRRTRSARDLFPHEFYANARFGERNTLGTRRELSQPGR